MSKKFTSLLLVSSMLLGTFLLGSCGKDGADGRAGTDGKDGKSAYELAVENGYKGSETEWLASLVGEVGESGKSAYELAVEMGIRAMSNRGSLHL
ncbi:MAG: hypothetical protein DBX45_05305 [Oscillospiraceae bacterium]|nr:MAG: hypothetical protein DBX45_05305 [Oscillospiraceae bacterium]